MLERKVFKGAHVRPQSFRMVTAAMNRTVVFSARGSWRYFDELVSENENELECLSERVNINTCFVNLGERNNLSLC